MSLYPGTWFGTINDERWDVFPPYFALQKTNVRTGEREQTAYIIPPHIGEEYLKHGSVLQRPLEESVLLIWPDGDDALEYARRVNGQPVDLEQDPDDDPYFENQYQEEYEYGPEHGEYYQQQQEADVFHGPYPEHYVQQEGQYNPAYGTQMPPQHQQPVIAQLPYNDQHVQQHPPQTIPQHGTSFAVQYVPQNILFGRPPGLEPGNNNQLLTWQPPPGVPIAYLPLISEQQFVTAPPLMDTDFYRAPTPGILGHTHQPAFDFPVPSTPPPPIPTDYGRGFAPGYFENQFHSPQVGQKGVVRTHSTRQKPKGGSGKTQRGNEEKLRPKDMPPKEDESAALQSIPVESENVDIVKEDVDADVTEAPSAQVAKKASVVEMLAEVNLADEKPESSVAGPSASVQDLSVAKASASESAPSVSIHASTGFNGSNGGSGSPTSVHSHKTTSSSGKSLRLVLSQKSHQLLSEAAEEASNDAEKEVQAPMDEHQGKKKSLLTPSKTKAQLRKERIQSLKHKAAQEAAEFDRMLEAQRVKDQEKLQKELNSFKTSLEFYIRVLSRHRSRHFALRQSGYGQLRGVQKNIVDFYKTRCVFLTKYEIQDCKVVTFLESKKSGYEKDKNPRLFGMFTHMMELIATTPIVQQDLFWLYGIRQQPFFKKAVQQLYSYILYSPKLRLGRVQKFTAEEVQAHFQDVLAEYGSEPYEGFAEYLNRAVALRSLRRPIPPEAPKPLCRFEKWITDEYIDFMKIDATWTQEKTTRFANLVKEVCEGEEDMEGCSSFIAHLPSIRSEIIDYDFSKFDVEYPDLKPMHLVGYFGLLIGGITDDYDDWDEDFLLRDFE